MTSVSFDGKPMLSQGTFSRQYTDEDATEPEELAARVLKDIADLRDDPEYDDEVYLVENNHAGYKVTEYREERIEFSWGRLWEWLSHVLFSADLEDVTVSGAKGAVLVDHEGMAGVVGEEGRAKPIVVGQRMAPSPGPGLGIPGAVYDPRGLFGARLFVHRGHPIDKNADVDESAGRKRAANVLNPPAAPSFIDAIAPNSAQP